MKSKVEIQFDGMTTTIIAEPTALFRIINSLNNDGRNTEIRYYDEEIKSDTFWQRTSTDKPTTKKNRTNGSRKLKQ